MADSRYLSNQQSDLGQLLQEAHHRWLRSTEICQILSNYQKFHLAPQPPVRPPAGSLFLFDRKSLRYFRKDGHRWRKKNDGKTVKEAHEKLKVGSVDVLHCYYAHGEENENFQRRSYWMLDRQLEHIVLVHYREVEEGYKSGISRSVVDPASRNGSPETSSGGYFGEANSSAPTIPNSYTSSPNGVELSGQTFSSEFEGFPRSSENYPISLHAEAIYHYGSGSSVGGKFHSSSGRPDGACDQTISMEQPSGADIISHKLTDARLEAPGTAQVQQEHDLFTVHPQFQKFSDSLTIVTSTSEVENKSKDGRSNNDESVELKKLDSFGRWMDKEIGGDCDDSLMASDSGNYWNNSIDAGNDDKEVSSLSHHLHLDIVSVGPSLSQDQLFSVCDFSPDWAYSGVETKVLIAGSFLGSRNVTMGTKWGCMFGEIEVSAEVLNNNVIRCQTPSHAPGRVPFYVTCSNRLACSEVREFEYREKPPGVAFSMAVKIEPENELRFQMRLAKLLCLGPERKWLDCSIKECDKCKLQNSIYSMKSENKIAEKLIDEISMTSEVDHEHFRDALIQNLLKDRLYEWLVCKVHEGESGPRILNDAGLGVIHMAAALGYEWAMRPIIAAGINPNFRDARGRTGLHWASYYGREETVTTLVRLGAAPGAVEDPTPSFPGGQTAADLASSRGHKGIAGFLAEADLTSHLSALTVKDFVMDSVAVTTAGEKAIETTAQVLPFMGATNEELSLKGSLAAVRKSAYAAAVIQESFRSRSFRHKQLTKSGNDISEVPCDLVALGFLNKAEKVSCFEDYLHSAAVKIQQRYRGWKRRKEFLKIRNRIVRIQAHVRGHQVRKQYKKVVWSVSIVEKAILRWRRKGAGLRGFQVKKAIEDILPGNEKIDEYEFLHIGRRQKFAGVEKALARVKSMVRDPEARDQYMRLVSKFENFKGSS